MSSENQANLNGTDLDKAIEGIGRYFGIITKGTQAAAATLSALNDEALESSKIGSPEQFVNAAKKVEGYPIVQALLDITEGGKTTAKFLEAYKNYTSSADESEELSAKNGYLIRVTCDGFAGEAEEDEIDIINDSDFNDEGVGLPDGQKVFSINRMLGLVEPSSTDENDRPSVNANPHTPSKSSPGLSVYQVFPSRMSLANRDTGAISVFLNAMPTLELSRCVPVLDLVLISSQNPTTPSKSGKYNRVNTLSLGKFMLGSTAVKAGSANDTILNALDEGVRKDVPPPPPPEDDEPDQDEPPGPDPIATAGMEMFTSPQTLVPADEVHMEYDDPAWQTQNSSADGDSASEEISLGPGGKRAAPIIDRFRPFMSIKNFDVNVAPSTGMMSYKSANLKLVLHDRSRLAEIAPLVRPDTFASTQLLIEYGWAHPDAMMHASPRLLSQGASPFGLFMGSLRCKEKYQIVNSSFTFDDVGQVEIDIKLAMLGGNDAHTSKISQGGEIEDQLKAITKLTEAISIIKKKIKTATGGSSDTAGEDFLGASSSTSGAMNVDKKTLNAIKKFINNNKKADEGSDMGNLRDSLVELYGPNANGKEGKVADLQKSIADEVGRKIKVLKDTEDPFLRDVDTKDLSIKREKNENSRKYVSLGKILTVFCGLPIAASGKYDDVQMIFYCFNSNASYMADYNVAQFPIGLDDFENIIKEETKANADLSVQRFLAFLSSNFIIDDGAPGYGMTKIYGDRDKEDKKKRKVNKKFEEKTALFNAKQAILEHAYGEGKSPVFKKPRLGMITETVPGSKKDPQSPGETGGEECTILRIHVFDKQATTYDGISKLLDAARSDAIGIINKESSKVGKEKKSDEKGEKKGSAEHDKDFAEILKAASEDPHGLLEALPINAGATAGDISVEEFPQPQFRLRGGFPALKKFISSMMPSIIYGSMYSGVMRAQLSSIQNPALASVNMTRQGFGGPNDPQGSRDAGLPAKISPTELVIETVGCPLFNFGQQFFVDFSTGTTIDNVYAVTGIDHNLSPGEFKTTVKLIQIDTYGKYEGMFNNIQKALTVIADNDAEGDEE